ncbi:methyltransferase family protein [Streptacidiphilus jiangxiensis]|uniref:Protein-S-isoprenylcysteine O-methyltransferase Ste14 n=1 Tax=Streptacidiphilus jiangxiensis TaxID=235985 RepID=A0A1H7WSK3_STRJI|nr:isoprenylcysteine carboxylmethyltransferase family protein [Streptacidiphilus jiangxiensis]SEM24540.1 Protein-S-isoprenylcysteine O-methyltransferase Ste14 [Streptacidiphilus jiangxiensis]
MSGVQTAVHGVIYGCLAVFGTTWVAGAIWFGLVSAGSQQRRGAWLRGLRASLPARLALAAGVVVLMALTRRSDSGSGFWSHLRYWNPALGVAGAALAVAATALLVWARLVLGAMWASVPLVQEGHELRTTGPYRHVRHPIYTGFLGVVLGATLGLGFGVWLLYAVAAVPWLLNRVRVEDNMMAAEFGDRFLAYRLRVPALLPLPRGRARTR